MNFSLSIALKHAFTPVTMGTQTPSWQLLGPEPLHDDDNTGTQPTLSSSRKVPQSSHMATTWALSPSATKMKIRMMTWAGPVAQR